MTLLDNLISYWKFDGNCNDSVGTNNGTDSGVTYGVGTGKILQAGSYLKDSYSSIPHNSVLDLSGAFTFAGWIYQTNTGTSTSYEENILNKDGGNSTNNCYRFMVRGPQDSANVGKLRFVYNVPSDISVYSTSTVSLNAWHHVGIVSTNGTYTFYLDGSAVGSGSTNITPSKTANIPFAFGEPPATFGIYTEGLIGKKDEFGFWNRALSSTEFTQLYNSGNGLQYPFGLGISAKFLQMF